MRIAVLGSTGSIGLQALEEIRRYPQRFEIVALSAGKNVELLARQAKEFGVLDLGVSGEEEAIRLKDILPKARVRFGPEGLAELASLPHVDLVLNAVVGAVGIFPTLSALRAGKRLALANKESLVVGGELVLAARLFPDQIIPVDSEHAALWQLFSGVNRKEVERIWITASGGPFRNRKSTELTHVRPEEALNHPTWKMGARITIDSATLVNKAFEVIEAHHLFGMPWERIGVLLHPESVVHALVELQDGSMLAQLATPDMRLPIRAALSYPERLPPPIRLRLAPLTLTFRELPRDLYPAFWTVLEAGKKGGTVPAVANAADEVLVQAFLDGKIPFTAIAEGLEAVICRYENSPATDLESILRADSWGRAEARRFVAEHTCRG
ncbi:MAG: 1-deoxy-D-xylulose-5-phosphate reductoisomerase [Candidatus Bipolaricaulota bacterium]|nr:1-deoxy-D-xylulose-5-phosphate reductoisomerase [Candidatus Bipolaricaulota bacterium]MDW8127128.1 1-deoxy-D-xylulose-5-phosphate reductoisomerase [Candidatus Bipolaricaulota bacterium]